MFQEGQKDDGAILKVLTVTTPSISYSANTETNGTFDFSSQIPSGYVPVGIIGFNTNAPKTYIRRLYLRETGNVKIYYSITSSFTQSVEAEIVLLLAKSGVADIS